MRSGGDHGEHRHLVVVVGGVGGGSGGRDGVVVDIGIVIIGVVQVGVVVLCLVVAVTKNLPLSPSRTLFHNLPEHTS